MVVTEGGLPDSLAACGFMSIEDTTLFQPGRLRLKSAAGLVTPGRGNPSLGPPVRRSKASSGRGQMLKALVAGRK